MCRLRPAADVDQGLCEEEVLAIKAALSTHVHKAPWTAIFQGNNFRRTSIVLVRYTFQQITGHVRFSAHGKKLSIDGSGIRLYVPKHVLQEQRLCRPSITYPVINSTLSVIAVLAHMWLADTMGYVPYHPSDQRHTNTIGADEYYC
jgi:hypothetical protein